jgi:hypothetical protein
MKDDGYEPVRKNARWCLLKRPEYLTTKQTAKLSQLIQYNLRSVKASLMREDFQRFWEDESVVWAGKFLDQWHKRAMRSKIEPMKKMARTLRRHRELMLMFGGVRYSLLRTSPAGWVEVSHRCCCISFFVEKQGRLYRLQGLGCDGTSEWHRDDLLAK